MRDVGSFLAIPSKDVCSSRAPGRPDRSSCGGCPVGHAGPKPPNRGGKKDHPLCHGPTEKRRGERAVHVEVSAFKCHLLNRADLASEPLTTVWGWERFVLLQCGAEIGSCISMCLYNFKWFLSHTGVILSTTVFGYWISVLTWGVNSIVDLEQCKISCLNLTREAWAFHWMTKRLGGFYRSSW